MVNNILTGSGAAAVLFCGNSNDPNPPQISFNDVWNSTGGSRYGGICPDTTGRSDTLKGGRSPADCTRIVSPWPQPAAYHSR